MSDAISKAIVAMDMARSHVGPFHIVVIRELTESIEALQALQSGEAVAWCFTDVNGRPKELVDHPKYKSDQDMRIYTPLYTTPQPVDRDEYVPMADYKKLSDLCSRQGMRLMDYETVTDRMECKWTQDDDGIWNTACGNAHEFVNEGPAENEHHFCPYCGDLLSAGKETDK